MGLSGFKPDTKQIPLSAAARRGLGLLLLAAGVFAYLALSNRGGPLGGALPLPERPPGTPLAAWDEAPLVVYVEEAGPNGVLAIAVQTAFEAGIGTVSVWLETAAARAEFVNTDTLYPDERSVAWLGELTAAAADVRAVRAQHRGKLTQAAHDFRCEPRLEGEQSAAGPHWVCERR